MKEMIKNNIQLLKEHFILEQANIGSYAKQKVGPMTFEIQQFHIKDIGNLAIMQGKAMLGLMKMDTLIITPTKVDAPLFSYDRIYALGNDTLIVEIYDTLINKEDAGYQDSYQKILNINKKYGDSYFHDLGKHWYDNMKLAISISKKGKVKKQGEMFDANYLELFEAYIHMLEQVQTVDETSKKEASKQYVEGLFINGGPSTDQFVKAIGKEASKKLFYKTIFGIE